MDTSPDLISPEYSTELGMCFMGKAEEVLVSRNFIQHESKIDLIFTSPPFPLNRKKKYGNLEGEKYLEWLGDFADRFMKLLSPTGSVVIEMGNSWERGAPVMSTLALRALLHFLQAGNLHLCETFIWHNPARLPSPAQWVNIERIRVKDAYTHIWWMSPIERPKANNRNVLNEYSPSMKQLLNSGKYNPGPRPSEHNIGKDSFKRNNKGSIPSNVLTIANTSSSSPYIKYCKKKGLTLHPARMPIQVAEFFIQFLTEPGDIVLDPFAGSNTTGEAAEKHGRRWIAIEADAEYVEGSRGRFFPLFMKKPDDLDDNIRNEFTP